MFGCMNDMQHQGNWASPSISNEIIIVPSNEGVLHKYSISQNSFDLINKFPEILQFSDMNDIFISVCEFGNIEIAKFLINIRPDINFFINNHEIIRLVSII